MRRLWQISCLLFLALLNAPAHAEGRSATVTPVTSVAISCVCQDAIGQAYVAAVKQLLSKDSHFQQVDSAQATQEGTIRVRIMSLSIEPKDGTPRSVLSIVYMRDGALVQQLIETCAHIPLIDCAQSMVQDLKSLETSL